jgi:hypothetical protein
LIVSSGVGTKNDLLAVEFTMSPDDIERLTCLPTGWFVEKEGKLVHLKVAEGPHAPRPEETGTIIPFSRRQ